MEGDSNRASADLVVVEQRLHSGATEDAPEVGIAIEGQWSVVEVGLQAAATRSIAQAIVDSLRSIVLGAVARRMLVSSVAMGMVEVLGIGEVALHVRSLLP